MLTTDHEKKAMEYDVLYGEEIGNLYRGYWFISDDVDVLTNIGTYKESIKDICRIMDYLYFEKNEILVNPEYFGKTIKMYGRVFKPTWKIQGFVINSKCYPLSGEDLSISNHYSKLNNMYRQKRKQMFESDGGGRLIF